MCTSLMQVYKVYVGAVKNKEIPGLIGLSPIIFY